MVKNPIPITIEKEDQVHNFDSIGKCAKFLECQPGQLLQTYNGKYKGWKVTLHGERSKQKDLKKKTYLFERTGEFIQEFDSVNSMARFLGITAKDTCRSLNNGKYKDYILSYSKQNENTFDINDFN